MICKLINKKYFVVISDMNMRSWYLQQNCLQKKKKRFVGVRKNFMNNMTLGDIYSLSYSFGNRNKLSTQATLYMLLLFINIHTLQTK